MCIARESFLYVSDKMKTTPHIPPLPFAGLASAGMHLLGGTLFDVGIHPAHDRTVFQGRTEPQGERNACS